MSTSLQGFPPTNRYEPLAELGRGGSGIGFLAFYRGQGLGGGLKTLHRFSNDDVKLLKHEFRALAGPRDPNLIQLYELASSTSGQCYVTMEYVETVDFLEYVRPEHTPGSFDEARLRSTFAQIARGVAVLHQSGFL